MIDSTYTMFNFFDGTTLFCENVQTTLEGYLFDASDTFVMIIENKEQITNVNILPAYLLLFHPAKLFYPYSALLKAFDPSEEEKRRIREQCKAQLELGAARVVDPTKSFSGLTLVKE